jgi:hypothetical protein
VRRLPGPADDGLGDGGNSRGSLRIVSGLAENTNSIFCADSLESQSKGVVRLRIRTLKVRQPAIMSENKPLTAMLNLSGLSSAKGRLGCRYSFTSRTVSFISDGLSFPPTCRNVP